MVIAAEPDACVAITFGEVLATSDLPGGVVNMLTGSGAEIAPHLAAHGDVNALDLTGADRSCGPSWSGPRPAPSSGSTPRRAHRTSPPPPGTARLRAFLEIKTVWHPTGALSLAGGSSY